MNITLPSNQEEIPTAVAKIRQEIAAKGAELRALEGVYKAIRGMCSHPQKGHKSDYDGGSSSWCLICHETW